MRKDYARNDFTQGGKSARKKRYVELLLVILLCVLVGGIFYAGYSATHPEWQEKMAVWTTHIQSFFGHKRAEEIKGKKLKGTAQIEYDNEVRFDFYSELPKMQMDTPPVVNTEQDKESTPAKQYTLRIGEFTDLARAGEVRISLLLAGVDAEVVTVRQDGKNVYRVQQSYDTAAQAQAKQKRLQKKGIESTVITP